jgi:hypothetical protein
LGLDGEWDDSHVAYRPPLMVPGKRDYRVMGVALPVEWARAELRVRVQQTGLERGIITPAAVVNTHWWGDLEEVRKGIVRWQRRWQRMPQPLRVQATLNGIHASARSLATKIVQSENQIAIGRDRMCVSPGMAGEDEFRALLLTAYRAPFLSLARQYGRRNYLAGEAALRRWLLCDTGFELGSPDTTHNFLPWSSMRELIVLSQARLRTLPLDPEDGAEDQQEELEVLRDEPEGPPDLERQEERLSESEDRGEDETTGGGEARVRHIPPVDPSPRNIWNDVGRELTQDWLE